MNSTLCDWQKPTKPTTIKLCIPYGVNVEINDKKCAITLINFNPQCLPYCQHFTRLSVVSGVKKYKCVFILKWPVNASQRNILHQLLNQRNCILFQCLSKTCMLVLKESQYFSVCIIYVLY